MRKRFRGHSWSEFLNPKSGDMLFVKFVFSEKYGGVEEFIVVYLASVAEKPVEVVKYDCSEKEAVHIHGFVAGKKEKKYIKREKSFETLEEFIGDIRNNWRFYKSRFMEGKP